MRKRTESAAVLQVLAIKNHEQRYAQIRKLITLFAQEPAALSRRGYADLQKDLRFLATEWLAMDFERAAAALSALRLKQIFKAKLAGRKVEPEEPEVIPEAPKPSGLAPDDPWNRFLEK